MTPLLIMTLTVLVGVTSTFECGDSCKEFFDEKHVPIDDTGVDPGEPLYLSPFIDKGEIMVARMLSIVGPLYLASSQLFDHKSYSGFLTVNSKLRSNMFFWFFPSQADPETDPLILWLQGGPGGSSMFGLFGEHGPLRVDEQYKLHLRNVTWNKKYSVIYLDNPVGAGFSYTEDDAGYAKDESDVAANIYSALTQFFKMFPEYLRNEFYVSGESYGGKYVPAITHTLHMEITQGRSTINLKGMAIGDGFCDPINMIDYGDFLYNAGLVDEKQRNVIKGMSAEIVKLIQDGELAHAFDKYDQLLIGVSYPSYYMNVTGNTDYYNILRTEEPEAMSYYYQLFADPAVRRSIHVGSLPFGGDSAVAENLFDHDFLSSVKPWVVDILDAGYKVLFYNGQLDIIVAYPMTEDFLKKMSWRGQQQYWDAERIIWKVSVNDTEVAGYARQVQNLYQVMIKGAGHICPFDQPERTWDALDRFINGRGFIAP